MDTDIAIMEAHNAVAANILSQLHTAKRAFTAKEAQYEKRLKTAVGTDNRNSLHGWMLFYGRMIVQVNRLSNDVIHYSTFKIDSRTTINRFIDWLQHITDIAPLGEHEIGHRVLYDAAGEALPRLQKVKTLLHIARAHPKDTIKRARRLRMELSA